MLVSAVIPVHNGRDFIVEAIGSVFTQSHSQVECIVVDDGSTDGTLEVVSGLDLPVRCLHQEKRGVARARNVGAAEARGDYLAFLDADDIWETDKLERQLLVSHRQRYPMTMCSCTVVDAALRPMRVHRMASRNGSLLDMVLFEGAAVVSCSSTGLIECDAFERLGGFDERLSMSADWDFLARCLLRHGGIGYADEALVKYRVHQGNMSQDVDLLERDMRYCFSKLYADSELPDDVRVREADAYANLYKMLAASHLEAGHYRSVVRNAVRAVVAEPRTSVKALVRRLMAVR